MNQQKVHYTYQPHGFQDMVVPNNMMQNPNLTPMDKKSAMEKMQMLSDYGKEGKYTRLWFILSFFIHATLSFLLLLFTLIGMFRNEGNFPILRTSFTSKYGDLPDTIHPTLYGFTTILMDQDVGFKPVPSVPVSFQDVAPTDGRRIDSNYYCVDGTLNYTKTIGGSVLDQTRAKGICMVERYSAVATYENHESSMTFSSAWSPMFMITVLMWISTSWQLIYVDFTEFVGLDKKYFYAIWQLLTLFFIMAVSYVRTNDQMVPRNNIMFAVAILVFSVIQQIYLMNRHGKYYKVSETEYHRSDDINFIRKMYKVLESKNMNDERIFTEKQFAFIVLLSDWFLLPLFCISMFALLSNNLLEWVFQATYVRYQLIIFGFVLIQQLKVVEQIRGIKSQLGRKNEGKTGVFAYEFHPRLVIVFAVLFAVINEVWSMTDTWATIDDHTQTKDYVRIYIAFVVIYFVTVAYCVIRRASHYEVEDNKSRGEDSSGTVINMVSSLLRVAFVFVLLLYLFGDYNKYSCWLSGKSTSLFCGHANKHKNLNNRDFLKPIAITSGDANAVFHALYASVTYSPVY